MVTIGGIYARVMKRVGCTRTRGTDQLQSEGIGLAGLCDRASGLAAHRAARQRGFMSIGHEDPKNSSEGFVESGVCDL